MPINEAVVKKIVEEIVDDERNQNVFELGLVSSVTVDLVGGKTRVTLLLASDDPMRVNDHMLVDRCYRALTLAEGIDGVRLFGPAQAAREEQPSAEQSAEEQPGEAQPAAVAPGDADNSNADAEPSAETSSADDGPVEISEQLVYEELKKVIDPELFVNIVDLGLIYDVNLTLTEEEKQDVLIDMTMTSPMCPAGPQMIANAKQVLGRFPEIGNVEVKIVLDPPWTPDKMTDDARDQLGIF